MSISAAYDKNEEYLYGFSAVDTKGKGNWGLYGELLFSYNKEDGTSCIDGACEDVTVTAGGPAFTFGVSYGVTDSLYGLAGVGLRFKSISTDLASGSCDTDDDDDDDETTTTTSDEYCQDDSEYTPSAQLGLLYVTPIGLSLLGTMNTDKTVSLGLGYQF